MTRMVKRLTGLEIDEVSLVNRPANQHGLVAIAKSQQEDSMSVYDANGDEVFEEELEHGDRVYDENGTEFVYIEDDDGDGEGVEYVDESGYADERELESVGKGSFSPTQAIKNVKRFGVKATGTAYKNRLSGNISELAGRKGVQMGAVGGVGAGVGYAGGRVQKSLGTQVLEELSKAINDDDRNQVFAKAADRFDEIAERNSQLEELVLGLYEDRDAENYAELAKGYELPIDPDEIGAIMHRASQVLPQEDLEVLDRLFSSVGEVSKAAFEEIGYGGEMDSDVLGQVYAIAGEAVSKSDASLSQEQAVTALFSANPAAYDQYEADQHYFR